MDNNFPKPNNNLVLAIVCTVLCCLPLGIVSIINAAKVDGLYRAGDYEGAQAAADNAKKYAQYSAICGAVIFVIYFFIGLAG